MPIPTSIADISTTAASNSPAGGDAIGTSLDDYLRTIQSIIKQQDSKGSDIASSTTITVPNAGSYFVVTGTTTIATIADNWNGRQIVLKFSGVLQLTNSSGLILPGAANITTAAGDCLIAANESTGVWRVVAYQRASGDAPLASPTFTGVSSFPAGSAALPSIIPTSDPNTGIYFPAADTVAVSTAGVERMRIDSSGNVGIGAIPGQDLDVNKSKPASPVNIRVCNSGTGTNTAANFSALQGSVSAVLSCQSDSQVYIGALSNHPVGVLVNSAVRFDFDTTGNSLHKSASGGLGYGTGAGGTVTQPASDGFGGTGKGSRVTLNKPTGGIAMQNTALAGNTAVRFQLNNSVITSSTDHVYAYISDNATANAYIVTSEYTRAGLTQIVLRNMTAGSLSEAVAINFIVIKGVTS